MAITRINVGTLANDGTGDDLRQAFVKVNNNFDELDAKVAGQATATNLGSGTGIFYSKEDGVIGLKSLVAGTNIEITNDADTITISNEGTVVLTGDTGAGSVTGPNRTLAVVGGNNISTNALSNTLTIDIVGEGLVVNDTSPQLGGTLNGGGNNATNLDTVVANEFIGALTGTIDGVNFTEFYNTLSNAIGFDYGAIAINVNNALDFLVSQTTLSYGTITAPAAINSDFGGI
jgi:hypothetical protein